MGQYGGDARWNEWLAYTNAAAQPTTSPPPPTVAYVPPIVQTPAVVQMTRTEAFQHKIQRTVRKMRLPQSDNYYYVAPGSMHQTRVTTDYYAIPPTAEEILGEPVGSRTASNAANQGHTENVPPLTDQKEDVGVEGPAVSVQPAATPWDIANTPFAASPTPPVTLVDSAPPPPPPPPPPPFSPSQRRASPAQHAAGTQARVSPFSSLKDRSTSPPSPFGASTGADRASVPFPSAPSSYKNDELPPTTSPVSVYTDRVSSARPPVPPRPPPAAMAQLVREAEQRREEHAMAEALWRQREISADRLKQENEDYGLLIAEERARRFRLGHLTIEEEEHDRQLAERLQEEFNREVAQTSTF